MPDVILVVLDHPSAAGAMLGAARQLAELCGAARINALLVRTPPEAMVSPSEEVLTAQREAKLRNEEASRATAVREVFDAWAASLPAYLSWMVQPRPTFGAEINSSRYTNQFYFGTTWTWMLANNIFQPGDGFSAGIFFGGAANDGEIVSSKPDRKSLGSHILFREALELGYWITPRIQISGYVDHVSNAGLAKQNQSINDVGARIGLRF